MYKEIPFYNKKDAIKSINELGENYFEIVTYDKNGNTNNSKIIVSKEQMLYNYINAIDSYLYHTKDKYEEAKSLINSNIIKKNCIKMLIFSIIVGAGLPALGYLMNSALTYYLGFAITALICVPTFFYAFKELTLKSSENEIKNSIMEYEDLIMEKSRVKKELEGLFPKKNVVKHKEIEPIKHEVKEKNKSLVRKKE